MARPLSRAVAGKDLEYVAEVLIRLHRDPGVLRGVRIVLRAPVLRHFTAAFELVP